MIIFPVLVLGSIISYNENNYFINTDDYNLAISRGNGMITSAMLNEIDVEIVSDYPNYNLFFSEFGPEDALTTAHDHLFFYPPRGATELSSCIKINADKIAVLDFVWDTEYIRTSWSYKFLPDQSFFVVDISRKINESYVYSNAQQCVMYSTAFDDTYIVDYTGDLHCTMQNNCYTYPTSATSQHSMFSAIDKGLSEVFPMMVWHEDQFDIVSGIICSYVSPNQRKTISYHGGGHYNQIPGFSEGQWNWFGKSDSESIFLKEGLTYGMQLYYVFDVGDVSKLITFNQELFNENSAEYKNTENYYAASLGGRSYPAENYFWRFPQVSSDYINSQELFKHRSFAIPCSQNGTRDTHIFNLYVKQMSSGDSYDLTPIYGIEPLFDEAETIEGNDYMIGSMSWIVYSFKNKLNYKVFEGSDKVQVSGEILILEDTTMKELYIELELSPRVCEVISLGDSIYDIRCNDEVYERIGIAVYNIQNIEEVTLDDTKIRLNIVNNLSDSLYSEGDMFDYKFTLFPHVGYDVQNVDDITPLICIPDDYYREDCVTLPNQLGNNNYGIYSNSNMFVYNTTTGFDSLLISMDLFCNEGYYPVKIHIEALEVKSIFINNEKILEWNFNEISKTLVIENNWTEGHNSLDIFNKNIAILQSESSFNIYPNPFNSYTTISFEFSQIANYKISIYNIKGQLLKIETGIGKKNIWSWDGKDNNQKSVASGIYFCEIKADNFIERKKMVLLK